MLKITAKFNNTESAQSAGRRIKEIEGVKDVQYRFLPETDRGNIVYGTNITAERGFLTSSGKLSVAPYFIEESACSIIVTAQNDAAARIRGIIFNTGGYDCSLDTTL